MKPQIVHDENNIAAIEIYESPTIKTYTSSELLDMIGPVQAGTTNTNNCDTILDNCDTGYYAPEEGANERLA